MSADHLALGGAAHHGGHIQAGCEALEFGHPVVHERRGAHDQARPDFASLIGAGHQQADELDRFAQAHLVGKHPAESRIQAGGQPSQAFFLVGAQRCVQPFRYLVYPLVDRAEIAQVLCEAAVAVEVGFLVEVERAERRQLHRARGKLLLRDAQVGCQAVKLSELEIGEVHERAIAQAMVALLLPVASQHGSKLVGAKVAGVDGEVDEVARKRHAHAQARLAVFDQAVERRRGIHLAGVTQLAQAGEDKVGNRFLVAHGDARLTCSEIPFHQRLGLAFGAHVAQRRGTRGALAVLVLGGHGPAQREPAQPVCGLGADGHVLTVLVQEKRQRACHGAPSR